MNFFFFFCNKIACRLNNKKKMYKKLISQKNMKFIRLNKNKKIKEKRIVTSESLI